jgi:hypothetical protein
MIFCKPPELWVFLRRASNIKHEHVVSLGHYSPIVLCSFARCTRPDAPPYHLPLWRCTCSPANHFCPGMLLPLP